MTLQVELIYDSDCPNVAEARKLLSRAFTLAGHSPKWSEFDRQAADSPPYAKDYGSPTILVNGQDVAENANNNAACCRLYSHPQGTSGIPQLEQVVAALKQSAVTAEAGKFRWRHFVAALPSLAALLPVLHCPACWPAYAGVLTAFGLGFLFQSTYLMPITSALLFLALFALGYRARTRHGYLPLALGLISVSAIILGKFLLASNLAVYVGLTLLFVASVWNSSPRKEACYAKD